jgi:phosphoribosylaminoimidazolecarboxamide formyltransferase/IMP cyclohydrolase
MEDAIENIDVGGPTMLRSAAKNFKSVLVVVDPNDYEIVSKVVKNNSADETLRRELAAKAFSHLSFYDAQIAHYLKLETFSNEFTIAGRKILDLRYGENPHQRGSVYVRPDAKTPFNNLQKLWGRDLSLINITDINAGLESVRVFKEPAAVVIKHNSPCGLAIGKTLAEALTNAIEADPESAFGGIIVLNKPMDLKTAKVIKAFKDANRGNMDITAAPSFAPNALTFLQNVRKSMGIYSFGDIPKEADPWNLKWIDGGFIIQTADLGTEKSFKDWKVVTKKKPTKLQLQQMQIGWKFITRIHSNSILVMDKKIPMTRGIGSGQTSRVRSTKIALEQAGAFAKNGILISDSFFPFPDSIEMAIKKGISAVVQQGGSINDQKSIDAANKAGIPMVFTNRRAFWH